jgi:hypothetical protein
MDAAAVCYTTSRSRVATPSLVTFDSGLKRHPVLERATKQRCCASLHELRAAPKVMPIHCQMRFHRADLGDPFGARRRSGASHKENVSHVMLLSPIWEILKSI